MRGRRPKEDIIALYTEEGYAVDFENLSQSLVDQAKIHNPDIEVFNKTSIQKIPKKNGLYEISRKNGVTIKSAVVIVDADAYSLLFAKQMGYGKHFSLIPIAGSFYFTKKLLNGKVYTVQEPKLPFAAVHGDPDVRMSRSYTLGSYCPISPQYLKVPTSAPVEIICRSSGLHRPQTWKSFIKILLDPIRFIYLIKNMLYELPWIGNRIFLSNIKKIIPTIKHSDIHIAKGYGGMRLQRVDTTTHELQLGEGKIVGDNIIFNMTPSPGASVSLYNALRDTEQIMKFLGTAFTFDKQKMETDLVITQTLASTAEPSIPKGYAS